MKLDSPIPALILMLVLCFLPDRMRAQTPTPIATATAAPTIQQLSPEEQHQLLQYEDLELQIRVEKQAFEQKLLDKYGRQYTVGKIGMTQFGLIPVNQQVAQSQKAEEGKTEPKRPNVPVKKQAPPTVPAEETQHGQQGTAPPTTPTVPAPAHPPTN